ncbi:MAG: hypothetical protein A2X49_14615 [Lentisphaerae bacterium GWF2_52_8]|nr:MAG: hypothetical protein A2X49_14615 [Lentisphaerae bacterium GWF2_52_8]
MDKMQEFHRSPLLEDVSRIVFLGDSLTDGSLYPDYVVNTLKQLYPETDFELINAGVCGDTAADLLVRLQADVIKQGPELVIVGIGTNDCSLSRKTEEFEKDLIEIIESIRDCASKLLLLRPSPRTDKEYASLFPKYLQVIDTVAARFDIPTADVHGDFERQIKNGKKLLFEDGVHHEAAAFEVMARSVLAALGHPEVELNMEIKPEPGMLLEWESSDPITWNGKDPLPSPKLAKNWKPYKRKALFNLPASGFPRKGAWMPFALKAPEKASISFGRAHFKAAEEGKMELQIGASHPLVIWLNGQEVWRSQRRHGYHPKAERMDVEVLKGENEIIALSNYMVFASLKAIGRINNVDGYSIGRHPLKMPPHQKAEMDLRDRVNAEVLAKTAQAPCGGHLSGSFIYAHPGGYRGRNTLNYEIPEWRSLFKELKELGMDSAIMGVAAWHDYNECFYPSEIFKNLRTRNVIEPMLAAAADEHMQIYLGGLVHSESSLGADTGDLGMAKACAEQELACYRELVQRYRGAFHGYYLASETGFWSWGNPEFLKRCYHSFFQRVSNGVKEITPELQIIGSPYTVRCPGREAEALDTLTAVHAGCPFTALAPQDSIGTTMNELDFLSRGLEIWKTVCGNIGAEFWVNCEAFNCMDYSGPFSVIVPAEFKRFAIQLDTAHKLGAKKLITWESIHFMNPAGSGAAKSLRSDYLKNRK